jgi:hypothetical protein
MLATTDVGFIEMRIAKVGHRAETGRSYHGCTRGRGSPQVRRP